MAGEKCAGSNKDVRRTGCFQRDRVFTCYNTADNNAEKETAGKIMNGPMPCKGICALTLKLRNSK